MIRAQQERTRDARHNAARKVGCACVLAAAGVMTCSAVARGAERPNTRSQQPEPWVTISLRALGVPSMPPAMMKVGSSMLTLDLVDDTHLLLTFSSRGLVPRVPDDPPDDEDRMVRAEVVELPSGRIVATTDWHMHDHARYLWRMGKGRFMVRSQRSLYVITPRALMNTPNPLKPMAFPSGEGIPLEAVTSPDESLLTVETMLPPQKAGAKKMETGLMVEDPKPRVMLDFYRMTGGDAAGQQLKLDQVGQVTAPDAVLLPMDSDGYLWPGDPQHGRWPLSFNEFGGHEVKIGAVDSSCSPRLQMVSRFEFLAFACMGTDSRTRLKAYGMDGHETWEDSLGSTYGLPEYAFAPAAGRFAISRISSMVTEVDIFAGPASVPEGSTQEVRVYQTESGDLLLKLPTSPVTRFAENFDLSEDGLLVAVVNDGAVEVYKLPPPSKQDLKDLALAKSFSPPESNAAVRFAKLEAPADSAKSNVAANAGDVTGVSASGNGSTANVKPTGDAEDGPSAGSVPVAGDVTRAAKVAPDAAAGPPSAPAAAVATQAGIAGPSSAAEPKTASATKDAAEEVSDEEAAKLLGAKVPAAQPAIKEAAASANPAAKAAAAATTDTGVAAKDAGEAQASGDATEATPRKPPTLLEAGEKVEKAKGPGQK